MTSPKFHPDFKLNGQQLNAEQLVHLATEFIKTGEPFQREVGEFILAWVDDSETIAVNTSGSTGNAKSINLLKEHMVNSAMATAKRFKIYEGTTALLCLPSRYIGGKMMLVRAMMLGWRLDLVAPSSNPLDMVYKRYDFCAMTPFQLDNSLARLHLLSQLIVGGGPLSESLKEKVKDEATKIYETYGMTETISHIAIRRVNPKKEDEIKPFKTVDKVTLSQDDRGCLVIKAPQVSTDPVVTNDMVKLLSYKKFIWLGRIDNVINSGGIKLYPEVIEAKLAPQIPFPFFVAGIPDDALGERVALILETDPEEAITLDHGSLDKYEVPKEILYCPKFERTQNGKLKRGATLRNLIRNRGGF